MNESTPPTHHPELAVEVTPRVVRVADLQGRQLDAEIFLHAESDRHRGPETLEERLNDPEGRFMPCRIDGETQLLNLDRLAWVQEDGTPPEVVNLEEINAQRTPLELRTSSGDTLQGDLLYLLPEARSRPSDAFNRAEAPFLMLSTPDTTYYVHRAAVLRVRFP